MLIKEKVRVILNFKVLIILAIVGFGVLLLGHRQQIASPGFQGYIEGEFVRVASPIAGALVDLSVKRGMRVDIGNPLFSLERENETAARDEANRRYEKAVFNLKNIQLGKRPEEIEVIEDMLAQAVVDQEFAALSLKRQEKLVITNATSVENLDRARSVYNRGLARIAELKAQLKVARLPAREMEIKAAKMEIEAAKEVLRQAQWRLDQKAIQSPVSGFVFDTLFVPGEWVAAGSPIAVILPPENIKVRFFVPEEKLGIFKIGQQVSLRYDEQVKDTSAILSYISPMAEYTPPVIYSREWQSKLLYMLEARPTQNPENLHPGQPVTVIVGLS